MHAWIREVVGALLAGFAGGMTAYVVGVRAQRQRRTRAVFDFNLTADPASDRLVAEMVKRGAEHGVSLGRSN
jgi:hypothetical protein